MKQTKVTNSKLATEALAKRLQRQVETLSTELAHARAQRQKDADRAFLARMSDQIDGVGFNDNVLLSHAEKRNRGQSAVFAIEFAELRRLLTLAMKAN